MHSQLLSGKLASSVPLQDYRRQTLQSGPPQSGSHLQPFSPHSPWPEHSSLRTLMLLLPLTCRLLGHAGTVQLRPVQPLLHWLSPNSELRTPGGVIVPSKTLLCSRQAVSEECWRSRMEGLLLGEMMAMEKSADVLKLGQSEEQQCGVRLVTLSAPALLFCMKVRQKLRVCVLRLQQMFHPPKRTDFVKMLPASLSTGELQRRLMLWLTALKWQEQIWSSVCRKRIDQLPVSIKSMKLMLFVGKRGETARVRFGNVRGQSSMGRVSGTVLPSQSMEEKEQLPQNQTVRFWKLLVWGVKEKTSRTPSKEAPKIRRVPFLSTISQKRQGSSPECRIDHLQVSRSRLQNSPDFS